MSERKVHKIWKLWYDREDPSGIAISFTAECGRISDDYSPELIGAVDLKLVTCESCKKALKKFKEKQA